MKLKSILIVGLLLVSSAYAQDLELRGKRVGLYISGKALSFDSKYYPLINQFLKVEEDRSWEENQKAEFMIRFGQRWATEVQQIAGADTVIFLNGDMELGTAYIKNGPKALVGKGSLDVIISLDSLKLQTRRERVSFIRSNKLYTSHKTIRFAQLHTTSYLPGVAGQSHTSCFDEASHKFPPILMDMYAEISPLGKFLSGLFSGWWLEVHAGALSRCGK
ncbi:MAG: hypothetical protein AB8F95_22850 [Bacteroidia bacterium]